jgi:chromate transporter
VTDPSSEPATPSHGVSFAHATRVWALVGLNSFGGPAGQIAVMHRMLVDQRRWFSERRFLHALNYCMLLPGPEAQQLATYIGWLMNGVRGGLLAGLLFILPGVISVMALAVLYAGFQDTTFVQALFYGIKPAVIALVSVAVVRIGARTLGHPGQLAIAAAAFVAIFFFDVPFPLIVVGAAMVGVLLGRAYPLAGLQQGHPEAAPDEQPGELEPDQREPDTPNTGRPADDAPLLADDVAVGTARPPLRRSVSVLLLGLAAWLGPTIMLLLLLGPENIFSQQGAFFSTAAVVTFGGAYAVLAFVAQQVVDVFGWIAPAEMLDGLGLAESTPGPLIMVVQFVGFLAAFRQPGALDPVVAGVMGGLLVSWVTFAPSFLWIFLGAPYAELLRGKRQLTAALSGITAAVVGVILNLALWFAIQTLFAVTGELRLGPLRLHTVELATFDLFGFLLAGFAFVALVRLKWPLLLTLAVSAGLGFAYFLAVGV